MLCDEGMVPCGDCADGTLSVAMGDRAGGVCGTCSGEGHTVLDGIIAGIAGEADDPTPCSECNGSGGMSDMQW